MSNTSNGSSGGIGFVGLLTVAFVVLKLTHVIDWSWWWVLAPLWISAGLTVAVLLIVGLVLLAIRISDSRTPQRRAALALRKYGRSLEK